ncbi:MAG TPA: bifunctional heptose 7-phosphate kinase/heptose 1-phosphate adenyltransferase, partial [Gammaproteobacteria bacterium]|nr:bifunctional heptose 7-phosphate kinase/heptose 1-phosphate adenyltransferase [Gammaproteobacteria bacterium]
MTGKDDACARLEAIFKPKGVHCEFITVEGSDTITKLRVISRQQQLIRLDFEDGFIH